MKETCEYCQRPIDTRGIDSHVYHRHRAEVIAKFRAHPQVQMYLTVSEILLAIRGDGPKLLMPAREYVESMLAEYEAAENSLLKLLDHHKIRAQDVNNSCVRVPLTVADGLRELIAFSQRLKFQGIHSDVWEARLWLKQ